MGVVIEDDNGNSFDLLKEIETVRFNLFNKQQRAKTNVQIEEITVECDESKNHQLEWLQEETSELEGFTLVQSRRKRREAKKRLKFSPVNKKDKKAQEDPSLPMKKGKKKS
jgi:uncharacterized protein YdgA (DUF945 family)